MPRPPQLSPAATSIKGSVYSSVLHRLAAYGGEVYPLHVGDTFLEPADGCRMEDLTVAAHPGMHRYAPPQGLPALVDAVVDRIRVRTGVPVERSNVFVAGGGTSGLASVVGAIVSPGDEVLILAPHWPLIEGHVKMAGGVPVDVPFFGVADSASTAAAVVEAALSPRTVALYVNTPSNPTGRVIPRAWLEALVALARRHDLWLLFDEVYEDYVYRGEHVPGLSLAPERSFAVHSFSKAYGMAGNRIGYVAGPAAAIAEALKISTHTVYAAPTAAQLAALRILEGAGDAWIARTRDAYRSLGEASADRLGVPRPEGSTFLFLDVAPHLDARGLDGFLEDAADRGLLLSPGPSFGPCPTHARICYTSAPPDVVLRGVEVLASLLGK
ncbi:MAG: pyridoxal phosphate-dependent aminotransferase [Holophagales bacterium]|nr:pyridoxal phosphate-dependent aminotransferase [Holophagales bacterium]